MDNRVLTIALAVVAIALATILSFFPVLSGGFYFDDFANLPSLGEHGPVKSWSALMRYVTSGIADPLGRPVATASFLLDARDWPAEARPFLRTNLILHIFNGLLLFAILLKLGKRLGKPASIVLWGSLFGAMFWCLHPLWVSTVGYIVQRHAILATSFVLLGLYSWIVATDAFREGAVRRGWFWAGVALPLFGGLAAFSKANGLLLPLLALTLQVWLLQTKRRQPVSERKATLLVLVVPSTLLVAALALQIEIRPEGRSWTLTERLLTQPRAILDYLLHLAVPRVNSPGLFADGFQLSTGLLAPPSTLAAFILLGSLAMAAVVLRKRYPTWSAALAFYLAGHLMESTVLPLELYFEHRNYLPAALLGWALAITILENMRSRKGASSILFGICLILAALTYQRASLWSNQWQQAMVWADTLPNSPRAQTWAAQHERDAGDLRAAAVRLERAAGRLPPNPMIALNLLEVRCRLGESQPESIAAAVAALSTAGLNSEVTYQWLREQLLSDAPSCGNLTRSDLETLVSAATQRRPRNPVEWARFHRLKAYLSIRVGKCEQASGPLAQALRHQKRDAEAYADTSVLASKCSPELAIGFLDAYLEDPAPPYPDRPGMPSVHGWLLHRDAYWRGELSRLRTLIAEVEDRSAP